jgi:tripartite-type tricarboxylate transporter receptor subunit TctC
MKTRVSPKLLGLFLCVVLILTLSSTVIGQPGEFVKGVLQPLADGFPKRPISLINVDDPGSRDGIYARVFQQALKSISPVPIIVSDEPAPSFGTFYKLKDLQSREGGNEGYYPIVLTLWGASTDPLVEPITKELGLDVSDMNMVIVTETMPYVMVQRKNAPWGRTLADLVKYAKAHPGELRKTTDGIGTGTDIAGDWVLQQLGVTVKKVPQPSTADGMAAVGAGKSDMHVTSSVIVQPHVEAGKMDVILVLGPTVPPPWDKDPNIVASETIGLPKAPMGTILGFCVPKNVQQTHIDWLFKLFKAGASTDVYKQREKTMVALRITIMDGAEANALKMKFNSYADPIVRAMGVHVDQAK